MALLTEAYTTIPLQLVQTYLGLPAENIASVAQKLGWSFDTSSQIFTTSRSVKGRGPLRQPGVFMRFMFRFYGRRSK